jgi:tRNA modification GTPase
MKNYPQDTIVAVSTPPGKAAIGIVRMSGESSIAILGELFKTREGENRKYLSDKRLYIRKIFYEGVCLDEVMVSLMRKPHSYTGEDVVEINCHGNPLILKRVVETCIKYGARMAEPGEFTRRAFTNGKMDLTKAEAVVEVINAKSEKALNLALSDLQGMLKRRIYALREKLMDIIVDLEAKIDFPEEEIEIDTKDSIVGRLRECLDSCREMLESYGRGRVIRDGFKAVLVGKTNAGKSCLFNRILQSERAIVTEEEGTTRDVIDESIIMDGHSVTLVDTAGIGTEGGEASIEGVKRTYKAIKEADIVLFVADISRRWSLDDTTLAEAISDKKGILVCNKTDLEQRIDFGRIPKGLSEKPRVRVSALRGDNVESLMDILKKACWTDNSGENVNSAILSNIRHADAMKSCVISLEGALDAANGGYSEEIIALETRRSIDMLDEITGDSVDEELLDRIFRKFCIGK